MKTVITAGEKFTHPIIYKIEKFMIGLMICSYAFTYIEQILKEFQKHGKSVKIAPELYGLYSIIDTNGEII